VVQEGAKKKRVEVILKKLLALDDERLKELKEIEIFEQRLIRFQ